MIASSALSPNILGLPSFKPQVRWAPSIANTVVSLGTQLAMAGSGLYALSQSHYSFGSTTMEGLAYTAAAFVPAALAIKFAPKLNGSAASSLLTRVLWKPIRKETLNDPDQVLNKTVLDSTSVQEAVQKAHPGAVNDYNQHYIGERNAALRSGIINGVLGLALSAAFFYQVF